MRGGVSVAASVWCRGRGEQCHLGGPVKATTTCPSKPGPKKSTGQKGTQPPRPPPALQALPHNGLGVQPSTAAAAHSGTHHVIMCGAALRRMRPPFATHDRPSACSRPKEAKQARAACVSILTSAPANFAHECTRTFSSPLGHGLCAFRSSGTFRASRRADPSRRRRGTSAMCACRVGALLAHGRSGLRPVECGSSVAGHPHSRACGDPAAEPPLGTCRRRRRLALGTSAPAHTRPTAAGSPGGGHPSSDGE